MRMTAGTGVSEHVETTTFPRKLSAAAKARRFVRQAAGGHPAAEEALLVAGELIANSLVHAADATRVTVTVAVGADLIRIDVHDDGTGGVPQLRQGAEAEGGRGLRLVDQVARRWGSSASRAFLLLGRGHDLACPVLYPSYPDEEKRP